MKSFHVLLFDDFTALDGFGPVEVIGKWGEHFYIEYYSQTGGIVLGRPNIRIDTLRLKASNDRCSIDSGGFGQEN
jgi:hypothetical protein